MLMILLHIFFFFFFFFVATPTDHRHIQYRGGDPPLGERPTGVGHIMYKLDTS